MRDSTAAAAAVERLQQAKHGSSTMVCTMECALSPVSVIAGQVKDAAGAAAQAAPGSSTAAGTLSVTVQQQRQLHHPVNGVVQLHWT
jgi:hypothetical protein